VSKEKRSLLDDARNEHQPSGRVPLLIRVAQTMSETERKELVEALDDVTVSAASLSRALRRRGHNVSASAIGQYRRGEIVRVIT
jgi:hypothetical protein